MCARTVPKRREMADTTGSLTGPGYGRPLPRAERKIVGHHSPKT